MKVKSLLIGGAMVAGLFFMQGSSERLNPVEVNKGYDAVKIFSTTDYTDISYGTEIRKVRKEIKQFVAKHPNGEFTTSTSNKLYTTYVYQYKK